jgi:hypothetical protein
MEVTVKNGSKVIDVESMTLKEIQNRISEIEESGIIEDAQELVALRSELSFRIWFNY